MSRSTEELIELLSRAALTPDGDVGTLTAKQVAALLGHEREWVYAHAVALGGFKLPSDEWRFCPRGVALGVLGLDADGDPPARPSGPSKRALRSNRLAYPPARQVLADRPRRATTTRQGAQRATPEQRNR